MRVKTENPLFGVRVTSNSCDGEESGVAAANVYGYAAKTTEKTRTYDLPQVPSGRSEGRGRRTQRRR